MKTKRWSYRCAIAAACLLASVALNAATPAAAAKPAPKKPFEPSPLVKPSHALAQPACNSFYDAFHMNEPPPAATRSAGFACLNALTESSERRHLTKAGDSLTAKK